MSDFQYTHHAENFVEFDSTAVDYLDYNADTRQLFVEWNDSADVWVYSGVSQAEYDDAVDSVSVGRSVARLKQKYGPGDNLGTVIGSKIDAIMVPVASTKEFSLQEPQAQIIQFPVGTNATTDATAEFSLDSEPAVKGGVTTDNDEPVFTIYYDLDGQERETEVDTVSNYQEAINLLNDAAGIFDLTITVKRVVIDFE